MNIQIIGVGKIREKYIKDGLNEFLKRIGPYADIILNEVADERAPERLSEREEAQVKAREGERLLRLVKPGQVIIALDSGGQPVSSKQLAEKIDIWALEGKSNLVFIIGGSLGLHNDVISAADFVLSFGRMTFPHQLMRLILLEQIYRAFRINRGEPYHK